MRVKDRRCQPGGIENTLSYQSAVVRRGRESGFTTKAWKARVSASTNAVGAAAADPAQHVELLVVEHHIHDEILSRIIARPLHCD